MAMVEDRAALKEQFGNEKVLVIPAATLEHLADGIQLPFDPEQAEPRFIYRYEAEYNPRWRQLIPYIVLLQAGRIWLTRRLSSQGESRLHNFYSIGVGGHINPTDAQAQSPLRAALYRELKEELFLGGWHPPNPQPAAIINDLSSAVSRDHLGIVYLLQVPPAVNVSVREISKMEGRWLRADAIKAGYYDRLENWSRIIFDQLEQLL